MYRIFVKRIVDIVLASTLIIVTTPILLITCIALLVVNNGNVIFSQKRPGLNSKVFNILKFKTMNDRVDEFGKLLPDANRLTQIGKFIRGTSIDELPQLFNVVKGEMSLVGPRPLLVTYLDRYSSKQARRHEVKPGITGWAQVNGRNAISWEEKFNLDVWYVDNLSFTLDLKILWLTIMKVIKRSGISSKNAITMEEFKGDK